MKRKALKKDFDDPVVQEMGFPSIADMWTDEARESYGEPADVHPDVAARIDAESPDIVLDIGCGSGLLRAALTTRWIGIDASIEQLRQAGGPSAIADACALPFPDASFGAAASLYTLYFFDEPSRVADEAFRVLQPGGLFAVCAPSRFDAPEIAHIAPRADTEAFCSEDIPELLAPRFVDVEINPWDFPFLELRDTDVAREYLYFWYYPQLTREDAAVHAAALDLPLKLTKKGAWAVGRKPR